MSQIRLSSIAVCLLAAAAVARGQLCQVLERFTSEQKELAPVSMVYDPIREVVIAYQPESAETWEWDSETGWIASQIPGLPQMRYGVAVAFDESRGVMVAFGGTAQSGALLGETWEYDGTSWTKRAIPGPGPRTGAAMAYDPIRNRIVLSGGFVDQDLQEPTGETWEYDGLEWTLVDVNGFGGLARGEHAAAFSPELGMVVAVGGFSGDHAAPPAGTWGWTGQGWTLLTVESPPPRHGFSLTWVPARSALVAFGGMRSDAEWVARTDTWEFSSGAWREIHTEKRPEAHWWHGAAYHDRGDRFIVFGGLALGRDADGIPSFWPSNETWELDERGWRLISGAPSPGEFIAVPWRPEVLLRTTDWFDSRDWWWDGRQWDAEQGQAPPPEPYQALVLDTHRLVVVCHLSNGQTWERDANGWTLRSTAGPSPRIRFDMAFDSARGVTVLHGGEDYPDVLLSDTWEWDGVAWREVPAPGIAPVHLHAMAFDEARQVTVLLTQDHLEGETWEYDGLSWRRTPTGPPVFCGDGRPLLAYDAGRQRIICFTGDQLWQWDGSDWLSSPLPSPQAGSDFSGFWCNDSVAYDPLRRTCWFHHQDDLFRPVNIVWGLRSLPSVFLHDLTAAAGATATWAGDIRGEGATAIQWFHDASPVLNNGRITGADTETLHFSALRPEDAGQYTITISDDCGTATSLPATLTVVCRADHNRDGAVDVFDLLAYLDDWFVSAHGAELTDDERIDVFDLLAFLDAWFGGC